MFIPPALVSRLEQYCQRRNLLAVDLLGQGKDGSVWKTDALSAVKIHVQEELYTREVQAYIRLAARNIKMIAGFKIPELIDADDELLAIEMTVVLPPYLL